MLLIRSTLRPQIAHSDALHIVTPVRVYTRSHQQLPIVTAASIHGKPSKIAHSDARESIHGKECKIAHSDAQESIHGKPSTIAHGDVRDEYTRKTIRNCLLGIPENLVTAAPPTFIT